MSKFQSKVVEQFKTLQDDICADLERIDGHQLFQEDLWHREGGGGGRTRVIADGDVIEKGGVNFSSVYGDVTPQMNKALLISGQTFFATGVSIVLHPRSPMCPIIHMNVRYFEMDNGATWWFGGGIDLTPHYIDPRLATRFHQRLKNTCDAHHESYYSEFKKWADDYFFISHRNETRGVGGIFFDHLGKNGDQDKESILNFTRDVGYTFIPCYEEQIDATKGLEFGDREVDWQLHRRGRYAEFNLVIDRGTKFGLHSNGRTESILMSLPPTSKWTYQHPVQQGSAEKATLDLLKKDIDWIN